MLVYLLVFIKPEPAVYVVWHSLSETNNTWNIVKLTFAFSHVFVLIFLCFFFFFYIFFFVWRVDSSVLAYSKYFTIYACNSLFFPFYLIYKHRAQFHFHIITQYISWVRSHVVLINSNCKLWLKDLWGQN